MAYKVVMTLFRYPGIPQDEGAYEKLGAQFLKAPCKTEDDIIQAAQEADIVVTAMQPYSRRVIEALPRLRHICVIGIGYEGGGVEAATERGGVVANVPDYC